MDLKGGTLLNRLNEQDRWADWRNNFHNVQTPIHPPVNVPANLLHDGVFSDVWFFVCEFVSCLWAGCSGPF